MSDPTQGRFGWYQQADVMFICHLMLAEKKKNQSFEFIEASCFALRIPNISD